MASSPSSTVNFPAPAIQKPQEQPASLNSIPFPSSNGSLPAYNNPVNISGSPSTLPPQMSDIYGNLSGYPSSYVLPRENSQTNLATIATPSSLSKKEDRPLVITFFKSALECVAGTGGFFLGVRLAAKKALDMPHLIQLLKSGNKSVLSAGLAGIVAGGALTGALFSMVYQKYKTNAVDQATLIKDTLWGALGF